MGIENYSLEELMAELKMREGEQQSEEKMYSYVFMIGNEGLEGIKRIKDVDDLSCISKMKLRSTMNLHRDIEVYAITININEETFKKCIVPLKDRLLENSIKLN